MHGDISRRWKSPVLARNVAARSSMHGQRRAGLLIRPRNFESPSERAWVRGKEHSKGSGTLTEGSGVLSLCLIAVERVETRERERKREAAMRLGVDERPRWGNGPRADVAPDYQLITFPAIQIDYQKLGECWDRSSHLSTTTGSIVQIRLTCAVNALALRRLAVRSISPEGPLSPNLTR